MFREYQLKSLIGPILAELLLKMVGKTFFPKKKSKGLFLCLFRKTRKCEKISSSSFFLYIVSKIVKKILPSILMKIFFCFIVFLKNTDISRDIFIYLIKTYFLVIKKIWLLFSAYATFFYWSYLRKFN